MSTLVITHYQRILHYLKPDRVYVLHRPRTLKPEQASMAAPPVMVFDPGAATITRVSSTGPALGLIDAGVFASQTLTLPHGGVLVAYTDGMSEARDAQDEEFGDERLATMLTDGRRRSAAELCAGILDAVRAHRGARQDQDDVTALVVKAS